MDHIKPVFKCPESFRKEFSRSDCLLTISVGQETHEGKRFETTIKAINDLFASCTITLHDGLQRYTMALDKEEYPEYFRDISVKEGDLWLERNEKHLKKFSNLKNIIRWSTWLKHPDYQSKQDEIKKLIEQAPTYKKAFAMDDFIIRYSKRLADPTNFNIERARRLCFEYLLEECAVLCLWPETGCHFELYAGKHNAAMKETMAHFISPIYPHLLRTVTIGFNKRTDLKPQRFELMQSE